MEDVQRKIEYQFKKKGYVPEELEKEKRDLRY
jgi:hypothetical protein